eukprot:2786617-Amphidinium_carterae.1
MIYVRTHSSCPETKRCWGPIVKCGEGAYGQLLLLLQAAPVFGRNLGGKHHMHFMSVAIKKTDM